MNLEQTDDNADAVASTPSLPFDEALLDLNGGAIVPLPTLAVVDFEGNDVQRFLQSKLTCDARRWKRDGGSYAYAVDINGRVIFDAHFAYQSDGTVRAWIEQALVEPALVHLERYIIMEDVRMTPTPGLAFALYSHDSREALNSALGLDSERPIYEPQSLGDELYAVPLERSLRPAVILQGPPNAIEALLATLRANARTIDVDAWRALEIAQGFVRVGPDLVCGRNIPLEAPTDQGVHFNKGCYLGQEVVERLSARGTPAREFRSLTWDGRASAPGTAVVDGEGAKVGALTSVAEGPTTQRAIASIQRKGLAAEALFVGDVTGPRVAAVAPVR